MDTFTASFNKETEFDLLDKDGNIILQAIPVRADFFGIINGDSLTGFGANGVEIEVTKPEKELNDKGQLRDAFLWVDMPEFLQESFNAWLELKSTREWFVDQLNDEESYEG